MGSYYIDIEENLDEKSKISNCSLDFNPAFLNNNSYSTFSRSMNVAPFSCAEW